MLSLRKKKKKKEQTGLTPENQGQTNDDDDDYDHHHHHRIVPLAMQSPSPFIRCPSLPRLPLYFEHIISMSSTLAGANEFNSNHFDSALHISLFASGIATNQTSEAFGIIDASHTRVSFVCSSVRRG